MSRIPNSGLILYYWDVRDVRSVDKYVDFQEESYLCRTEVGSSLPKEMLDQLNNLEKRIELFADLDQDHDHDY